MASKLSAEWVQDSTGRDILLIKKKRGKLNINEITDFLMDDYKYSYKHFAILISSNPELRMGSGWMNEIEEPGDCIELIELEDGEKCPICGRLMAIDICPECGAELNPK